MRKAIIIFAAGLLALLLTVPPYAAASEFQFSLAFSPALPMGQFQDVLDKTVWGGTLSFAFRPTGSPVMIGTSLGFGAYETDHWETWLGLTDPDVLVDMRTTNGLLSWNVFLRIQPERGFLRPYIDLFAGLHNLRTDTTVEEGDSDDIDGDFSINNASDTAFAFGAGAGIQFPLLRFVRQDGRRAFSIELDLAARYAKGGRAEYLIETDEYGVFDGRRSRTDLLTLSAGLSFIF